LRVEQALAPAPQPQAESECLKEERPPWGPDVQPSILEQLCRSRSRDSQPCPLESPLANQ